MEYLEETRSEHALLPKDPADRAVVRALCQEIGSGIQPIQNLPILNYVGGGEKGQQWAQHWITHGFQGNQFSFLIPSKNRMICFSAGEDAVENSWKVFFRRFGDDRRLLPRSSGLQRASVRVLLQFVWTYNMKTAIIH